MGKIYVTGDLHGDMQDLYNRVKKNKIQDDDTLIVCGDFGFIWNGDWKKNMMKISRITKATIFVVLGNHENYDIIEKLPMDTKFNNLVYVASENVFIAGRGRIYTIEGKRFFCFGGALSIDRYHRIPRKSWWAEEEPTDVELGTGGAIIYNNVNNIDYVITHDCPAIFRRELYTHHDTSLEIGYKLPRVFDNWLEQLYFDGQNFKHWYCGHHHTNYTAESLKCTCLYKRIEEII